MPMFMNFLITSLKMMHLISSSSCKIRRRLEYNPSFCFHTRLIYKKVINKLLIGFLITSPPKSCILKGSTMKLKSIRLPHHQEKAQPVKIRRTVLKKRNQLLMLFYQRYKETTIPSSTSLRWLLNLQALKINKKFSDHRHACSE